MTQNDPTDYALAAIASILDHKDAESHETRHEQAEHTAVTVITQTVVTETIAVTIEPDTIQADTVEAHSVEAHAVEAPSVEADTVAPDTIEPDAIEAEPEMMIAEHESPSTVPDAMDVDGYSRLGPGPLDAIRFCWTARRDDAGQYFVDETIGSSRPISSGPIPRDEIIDFIDGRERAARDRFETLKSQMTVGSHASR